MARQRRADWNFHCQELEVSEIGSRLFSFDGVCSIYTCEKATGQFCHIASAVVVVRTLELRISTSALAPDIAYATRTAFLLCPISETLFLLSLS